MEEREREREKERDKVINVCKDWREREGKELLNNTTRNSYCDLYCFLPTWVGWKNNIMKVELKFCFLTATKCCRNSSVKLFSFLQYFQSYEERLICRNAHL